MPSSLFQTGARHVRCSQIWLRSHADVHRRQILRAHASAAAESASDAQEPAHVSRFQLWKMCIKPPMYTVGLAPMVTGAAIAYFTTGVFAVEVLKKLMFGSILVIAWLNVSNDAFDSLTGVDSTPEWTSKPESIVALTGLDWRLLLVAAFAMLLLGLWAMYVPLAACGSAVPAYLFGASIACGYLYQGPPFRLGYLGLGEPLCFVAFGPLAVTAAILAHALPHAASTSATAYLQTHVSAVAPAAVALGLTTTSILFCSHFHQIKGDKLAGKNSPLVRLGTRRGCQVLQVACVLTHAIAFLGMYAVPALQQQAALGILAAPLAVSMNSYAANNHETPDKIKSLKLQAIKWHTALTLALFLAFVTGGVQLHGADSLAGAALQSA